MSLDEMRKELSKRFEALKSGNPEGKILDSYPPLITAVRAIRL